MGAKDIFHSGARYLAYGIVYLTSLLPISCRNNTAILREDIAENYRYFSFTDTDNNGKFDIVVISDSPESGGIRERIVGEAVVDSMYKILSQKRYKKITGQDYPSDLEKTVQENETNTSPESKKSQL